jgi:signal peptidase II
LENTQESLDTTKESDVIFRASGLPGFRASGLPGFRASGLPGFRASGLDLTFPSNAAYSGNILKTSFFLRGIVFAAALIADRVAKYWAESRVAPAFIGQERVFPSLSLYHNYGMTFSLMDAHPSLSLTFSLVGIALLLLICLKSKTARSMSGVIFLWAGAIGNLSDRLMYGYVVDWIYVGGYINLADLWLCAGSFLVFGYCVKIFNGRSV